MEPSPAVVGYLESIVYGGRRGPIAGALRFLLVLLSEVYKAALRLYLWPFEIGLRKKQRLSRPVVSVGNITVGGTGKTPTVQYLCRGMASRGWNPAVLSYGYGGSLGGRFGIVSDKSGVRLTPESAGDEPVMLAAGMPGIPVLVCKDRARSGRAAISDLGADVLLLDDGFQVWKLHRDLDSVLVGAAGPFDNGRTLPAGRLREPPTALKRADCIIAVGDCDPDSRENVLAEVRKRVPAMPVYFGRFSPSALVSLADRSELPVEAIRGRRVLALSAVANPASFEETLAAAGAVIVGGERLPDHHLYSGGDIERINESAVGNDAEFIVTTEKDAVKLGGRRFAAPIAALHIRLELDDEAGFWELVARRIGSPPNSGQD